jgi:hypothetical protein
MCETVNSAHAGGSKNVLLNGKVSAISSRELSHEDPN